MTTIEQPLMTADVHQREKLFTELYKRAFPFVAQFISHRQGSLQDVKDIFQDALVIYYEKLQDDSFELTLSDEAYITGIAKHLWIRKFHHDKKYVQLSELEAAITIPENFFPQLHEKRVLQMLEETGKKCMAILTAFYYQRLSMQKISQLFGFRSERSATVQKFKCLEKIRDQVKSKHLQYEDFIE